MWRATGIIFVALGTGPRASQVLGEAVTRNHTSALKWVTLATPLGSDLSVGLPDSPGWVRRGLPLSPGPVNSAWPSH